MKYSCGVFQCPSSPSTLIVLFMFHSPFLYLNLLLLCTSYPMSHPHFLYNPTAPPLNMAVSWRVSHVALLAFYVTVAGPG